MDQKLTGVVIVAAVLMIVSSSGCINNTPSPPIQNPQHQANIMSPWGMLSSTDVSGEDISCIGTYSGMTRGLYNRQSYDDGSYDIVVVYYKAGDIFSNAKDYLISKAEECGYAKESESQINTIMPQANFAKGYEAEFCKGYDSLTIIIGLITQNGEPLTLVHIDYTHNVAFSSEDETPPSNEQEDTGNNAAPQEITPTGDAVAWNNEIKPIIESVFGKSYLISYSATQQMIYLKYGFTRKSNDNDVSAISAELENRGYSILLASTEDAQDTVTASKNSNYIVVVFYRDGDYVEVSITPQS